MALTTFERDICQRSERFSQICGEYFSFEHVVLTGCCDWAATAGGYSPMLRGEFFDVSGSHLSSSGGLFNVSQLLEKSFEPP